MIRSIAPLAATAAALLPTVASAQAADGGLTGNMLLTTDYRFRGLSQSFKRPAIQGGLDWSAPGGLYVGNWNSSISGNQYPGGAGIETDFYGGYKFEIAKDLTLDVGGLYYYYPGAFYSGFAPARPKFDNFEAYVGAVSGPFSAKVFVALTDFFGLDTTTGNAGSSGSYYVDLNYGIEIMPKTTLGLHAGYQKVRNHDALDYADYKVGLTYDWGGWLLGAAVGTDADRNVYVASDAGGRTRKVGEPTLVLSVGRTF